MAKTEPKGQAENRTKTTARKRASYSFALLISMLVVGFISGIWAFTFGQKALKGVNPIPLGRKLPAPSPPEKPKKAEGDSFLAKSVLFVATAHQMVNRKMQFLGSSLLDNAYISLQAGNTQKSSSLYNNQPPVSQSDRQLNISNWLTNHDNTSASEKSLSFISHLNIPKTYLKDDNALSREQADRLQRELAPQSNDLLEKPRTSGASGGQ